MQDETPPLLKWPGGKRWIASTIARIVQRRLLEGGRYLEPFAGGAAVFFALRPQHAILSDVNAELIEVYSTVRDEPLMVLKALRRLRVSRACYYNVRAARPLSRIGRAARFLYLNRTAFGGMYRLNRAGAFNVPYGGGARTPAILWNRGILLAAAEALRSAEVMVADFERVINLATRGDVIYCDPTYTVAHNNNGFVRYNERNFSWSDQIRLVRRAHEAAARGVSVIVSNAHHRSIAQLYDGWTRRLVRRKSMICPRPSARGDATEYLFISPTTEGRSIGHLP